MTRRHMAKTSHPSRFKPEPILVADWKLTMPLGDPFEAATLGNGEVPSCDPSRVLRYDFDGELSQSVLDAAAVKELLHRCAITPLTGGTLGVRADVKGLIDRDYWMVNSQSDLFSIGNRTDETEDMLKANGVELDVDAISKSDAFTANSYGMAWPVFVAPAPDTALEDESTETEVQYQSPFSTETSDTAAGAQLLRTRREVRKMLGELNSVSPLRKILYEIWTIENEFMVEGKERNQEQSNRLKALYHRAAIEEDHPVLQATYRFHAALASKNYEEAWRQARKAYAEAPDTSLLMSEFAKEFDYELRHADAMVAKNFETCGFDRSDKLRQLFVNGCNALDKEDWDLAWRTFEELYSTESENEELIKLVENKYELARRAESCIWATRYLKVAKTWKDFTQMQYKLHTLETYEVRRFWNNPKYLITQHTAYWAPNKLPVKIHLTSKLRENEEFCKVIKESLDEWMVAAKGHCDYEFCDDEKKANIVCDLTHRFSNYQKAHGGKHAPRVEKCDEKAYGITFPHSSGRKIQSVRIVFCDTARHEQNRMFKSTCLHELGHAFGLFKHSGQSADIMFAYLNGKKGILTAHDKELFWDLYKDHPVISRAKEKYVGMEAKCLSLNY